MKLLISIILIIFAASAAQADGTQNSLRLTFTVPAVCSIKNGEPACNLVLRKVSPTLWYDAERGYFVQLKDGQLLVLKEES